MVNDVKKRIIEKIRHNRISTEEIADIMGKKGLFENAFPVNRGHFAVGNIKWIYAYNESNWSIHEQARDIERGDIVLIEAFNCVERATIGELVTKFMLLHQRAEAVISNAKLRDGSGLIKHNYPVWCKGITPIGCFNVKIDEPLDPEIYRTHKEMYDGNIAVCDDSGVVIIPKELHNEEFLGKLDFIAEQEDIWFECLDGRNWDTYDIVCLKKYKDEKEPGK